MASVFLTYSAADFTTRSVVTTIETTTASLHVRVFVITRESDYGVMTNFRVEGVVYGRQVEGK